MGKGENKLLVAKAEYDYYPEYTVENESKKVIKKKKKVRAINKRMYITIAIIIFASNLLILYRYAKITEANMEISRLENQIIELEQTKQDLEGKLEGVKSTTMISEEAKNSLGMIYPQDGQVVYVAVDDSSAIEVANRSFSDKLKNIVSNFSSLF